MSWNDFVGKAYTREQFAARVAGITWRPEVWNPERPQMPVGIVLHNTAVPTLAQWAETGLDHDVRIRNLKDYYQKQGWNGGPHLFVSRDWINEFDSLVERGTHSPTFNKDHFGIEMVGNYSREEFNSGDGAEVRDNAVYAMAVLCRKFGWDPAKVIKLHKEDPATTHDCPGAKVDKADVVRRVREAMGTQKPTGKPLPKPPIQVPLPGKNAPAGRYGVYATSFGGPGDEQEGSYGPFRYDRPGVALPAKFPEPRPLVKVWQGGRSVICGIIDVGPHNIKDPYWETGARPLSESQFMAQKNGQNKKLVKNTAGIDLTPGALVQLGLPYPWSGPVQWAFISDEDAEKEFDHSPPPADSPPLLADEKVQLHGEQGIDIEVVQRKLKELGYFEVGDVDGNWGSKTSAGIAAFMNDRHMTGTATITDELKEELAAAEAEGWKRPIAPKRADATEETISEKVPEVRPAKRNKSIGLWGSITATGGMAVDAVSSNFKDAAGWVSEIKGYLGAIPGWVWLLLIVVACLILYRNSRKTVDRIVESVRTGERN